MSNNYDPSQGMYGDIAGSTILPNSILTAKVKTNELELKDGNKVSTITTDYTDGSHTALSTAYATFQGLTRLQSNINKLDPNNNFYRDNTVVSLPLIDGSFVQGENDWSILDWTVVDGRATFRGTGGKEDNYLKVPNIVFTVPGWYYINVEVARLDSGIINVFNNEYKSIATVSAVGENVLEIFVEDSDVITLMFVAEGQHVGDTVTLSTIGLYKVTDRFRDYFYNKMSALGLGEEVINRRQAEEIARTVFEEETAIISDLVKIATDSLALHLSDTNNPHNLTPNAIGASPSDHTHTEMGSMSEGLLEAIGHANMVDANPHKTTYDQVGAAPKEHGHIPRDIGAANIDHTHNNYVSEADFEELKQQIGLSSGGESTGTVSLGSSDFGVIGQYITSTMLPMYQPKEYDFTPPVTSILQPYLLHRSLGYYDHNDGMAYSSKLPIEYSAGMVFSEYHGRGAAFEMPTGSFGKTRVGYKFHTARRIAGYKVYRGTGYPGNGHATMWEAYGVDAFGGPLDFGAMSDVGWYNPSNEEERKTKHKNVNLGVLSSGEYPTVSEFYVDVIGATGGTNDVWSIRIEFTFDDVTDDLDEVVVPEGITIFTLDGRETVEVPIPVKLGMVEWDTPTGALYIKKSESEDESGEIVEALNVEKSLFSPDFYIGNMGRDYFQGKYASNNNPSQGNITSTSTPYAAEVFNIYGPDDGKNPYIATTSSLVEIVHTVGPGNQLASVSGVILEFNQDLIDSNMVPRGIRITLKGKIRDFTDNSIKEGSMVVFSDDNIQPSLADSNFFRLVVKSASLEQVTDVDKMTLELNYSGNHPGQTRVGIYRVKWLASYWGYNYHDGNSTDRTKTPYGRMEMLELPATSILETAYAHVGYPTSSEMVIPLHGGSLILPNVGEEEVIIIANPFVCDRVSVEILSLVPVNGAIPKDVIPDESDYDTYSNSVVTVDDFKINLSIRVPGRYGVRMKRLW